MSREIKTYLRLKRTLTFVSVKFIKMVFKKKSFWLFFFLFSSDSENAMSVNCCCFYSNKPVLGTDLVAARTSLYSCSSFRMMCCFLEQVSWHEWNNAFVNQHLCFCTSLFFSLYLLYCNCEATPCTKWSKWPSWRLSKSNFGINGLLEVVVALALANCLKTHVRHRPVVMVALL